MARRRSPHGEARRVFLYYRKNDPQFHELGALIEHVRKGKLNATLLDLLLAGLAAQHTRHNLVPEPPPAASSPDVHPPAPAERPVAPPPQVTPTLTKLISQNWVIADSEETQK